MKNMNKILKKIKFPVLSGIVLFVLISCERHDFLDENLITGEVGAQAYWEIESSAITAGSKMSFFAQYYTTEADIDHSEVWYNITETLEKNVSCPWVTTFTYSYSSTTSEEKRISQKIEEYPHSAAIWSDSLRAYTLKSNFPVSGTLSPFSWQKPEQFDESRMKSYFGDGFMQHFKDSLYTLMQYADFKNMFMGMGLLEDFKAYTDSTFDANSDSYIYHFPKDGAGETPVPGEIKNMFEGITFAQLIENSASGYYEVEYKRTYYLEAILRVYNVHGIYGTTTLKKIDIN